MDIPPNPFSGCQWYVDPHSDARRQMDQWRDSRPHDAQLLAKIADNGQADWFGDWCMDVRKEVDDRVTTIANAGALPVLVAYNIPDRDCGGYSSGGSASPENYLAWIGDFAAGIADRKAIVILEPDALAHLHNVDSPALRATRFNLLGEAIDILKANENTFVYLDAGNARWVAESRMAHSLLCAGAVRADGFSVNVSNFVSTEETLPYAEDIAAMLDNMHFVVDTSRNGLGAMPDNEWCNPPGRALGAPPTVETGHPLCDAFLWVKLPGHSDGECNGGPPAGQWWPEYALGLAERAVF